MYYAYLCMYMYYNYYIIYTHTHTYVLTLYIVYYIIYVLSVLCVLYRGRTIYVCRISTCVYFFDRENYVYYIYVIKERCLLSAYCIYVGMCICVCTYVHTLCFEYSANFLQHVHTLIHTYLYLCVCKHSLDFSRIEGLEEYTGLKCLF